jgi:ABC-type hemin transport system substrate-binding protein
MRAVRRKLAIACAALALVFAASAARAGEPIARRVVSMNPSFTRILVALGARDALVGVDDFSAKAEPAVANLPRVGGLYSPSLESVVALQPDLVVLLPTVEQRDFQQRLAGVALPVLALDPVGFDDVLATIEMLGGRVGKQDAARATRCARRSRRGPCRVRSSCCSASRSSWSAAARSSTRCWRSPAHAISARSWASPGRARRSSGASRPRPP